MSNVQLSSAALERIAARRTFPLHTRTGACRNLFGPVDHDDLHREMKSKLREISDRDQQRWNFNFEANSPLAGNYEWVESSAEKTPGFYRDSVQTGKSRVPVAAAVIVTPVRAVSTSAPSEVQESPAGVDVLPSCEERLATSETSRPTTTTTSTTTTTNTTTTAATSTTTSTTTTCPVEANQENRRGKLNSGIQTRSRQLSSSSSCARGGRKRTATPESNNTHITDFFVKRRRPTETKPTESGCLTPKPHLPVEHTPRKRIR
ncbi:hypothetical protein NHX12_002807 [Muraenolepis orangiensis]|uniref:Cyclin-dependent kinase inhibitor 1C n=1 Tax=Muraenolepis orangiensis TaxID=630683 RepID=A0A9Q0DWU8_9TELE|nr:hypothetical protein NHX12_002807 [Muraenolepis orangiensis]